MRVGPAWLARWERVDPRGSARARLGAIRPLRAQAGDATLISIALWVIRCIWSQEGDETLISIVLWIELAAAFIP